MAACKDEINKANENGPANKKRTEIIDIQVKALDDLVNVNSLFTFAVFVGLAFAVPGQRSLENRVECDAGVADAKRLVVFEVASFSCYLFSSLVAKTLKMHLNVFKLRDFRDVRECHSKLIIISREWMLYLSTSGSIIGCVFLTASMVEVTQIRLGKFTCGSIYILSAVILLIVFVSVALLIYVPTTWHAIIVLLKDFKRSPQKEETDLEKGHGHSENVD